MPCFPNAFRDGMSPPGERWKLRKQDDASDRNPAARISKIPAQEERRRSGWQDGLLRSWMTAREAKKPAGKEKWPPGSQKAGYPGKSAVREAPNESGSQNGRREAEKRTPRTKRTARTLTDPQKTGAVRVRPWCPCSPLGPWLSGCRCRPRQAQRHRLGHLQAIHGCAEDASGVAGPFARGVEALGVEALESLVPPDAEG